MTKRERKQLVWKSMASTLENDIFGNGANYLDQDEHGEILSEKQAAYMKEAAVEILDFMQRKSKGLR